MNIQNQQQRIQENLGNNYLNQIISIRQEQIFLNNVFSGQFNGYFQTKNMRIISDLGFLIFCVGVQQVVILAYIETQKINFIIPLYMFGLYCFSKLMKFIYYSKKEGCNNYIVQIVEHFLDCLFVLAICIYFTYKSYYFTYNIVPLFISNVLKLETVKQEFDMNEDLIKLYNMVGFILSSIIWLQVLLIGLKLDIVIFLNWRELLWPFWTILAILVITAVMFILKAIKSLYQFLRKKTTQKYFIGYFILFLVFSIQCVSLLLTSFKVLDYLNDEQIEDQISYALIFSVVSTPVSCISFCVFKVQVQQSLESFFFGESTFSSPVSNRPQQNQRRREREREDININIIDQKPKLELRKLQINEQNPQYLQKQSDTFFQNVQTLKNKQQITDNQQSIISQSGKILRRVIRKSNSFGEFEALRKNTQIDTETHINQQTLITSDSEKDGNRNRHGGFNVNINTRLSRIPHQFIGCQDEVIVFDNNKNQKEENKDADIHNIFDEENGQNNKKSESVCFYNHNRVNTSFYMEGINKNQEKDKKEENKDSSLQACLICFEKEPDSVFMKCGHGGICYDCAIQMWKSTSECYLCRQNIIQVLQLDHKNNDYQNKNLIKVISKTITQPQQ